VESHNTSDHYDTEHVPHFSESATQYNYEHEQQLEVTQKRTSQGKGSPRLQIKSKKKKAVERS